MYQALAVILISFPMIIALVYYVADQRFGTCDAPEK
jgi:hypothetical protein